MKLLKLQTQKARVVLTETGMQQIEEWMLECEHLRDRILRAELDTALETELPDMEDLLYDIGLMCRPNEDI